MASQLVATSGNRRLQPNQTAALRGRQAQLPGIMAQKKLREQRSQDIRFRNKEFNQAEKAQDQDQRIAKDTLAMQEKAQSYAAGVSALNLGMGVQRMAQANPTGLINKGLGSIGGKAGSTFGAGGAGSTFGNFTIGQGITSGLAGFGASRFAGGNKFKKAAFGAGAGALAGLLTGSGGSGIASGMGGAIFGGLGSLF